MTTEHIARSFLDALTINERAGYERILAEDCSLRAWRWQGSESHRPRQRVIARMMEEWSGWPDAHLETYNILADQVARLRSIASRQLRMAATWSTIARRF